MGTVLTTATFPSARDNHSLSLVSVPSPRSSLGLEPKTSSSNQAVDLHRSPGPAGSDLFNKSSKSTADLDVDGNFNADSGHSGAATGTPPHSIQLNNASGSGPHSIQLNNASGSGSGKRPAFRVKSSMIFKSPLTRAKIDSALFGESEKLRKVHSVALAASRRAAAEERLSKKIFKETKLLGMAQTNGKILTEGTPCLAFAVATAAKETLYAEREAVKLKLKEFIEHIELLRLNEDEVEEWVLDAEIQVEYLRDLYRSQGLKEEDFEALEVEVGSPTSTSSSLPDSPIRKHSTLPEDRSGSESSVEDSSASSEASASTSSSDSSSQSSPSFYKSASSRISDTHAACLSSLPGPSPPPVSHAPAACPPLVP